VIYNTSPLPTLLNCTLRISSKLFGILLMNKKSLLSELFTDSKSFLFQSNNRCSVLPQEWFSQQVIIPSLHSRFIFPLTPQPLISFLASSWPAINHSVLALRSSTFHQCSCPRLSHLGKGIEDSRQLYCRYSIINAITIWEQLAEMVTILTMSS